MTTVEVVGWGCFGGLLPDVLRLIAMRYKGPPAYLGQWFFWASLVLLVIVAGLTVYLLSPGRVIDAVAIGFSAPEILSTALGKKEPRYQRLVDASKKLTKTDRDRLIQGELHVGRRDVEIEAVILGMMNPIERLRLWWGGFTVNEDHLRELISQ